MPELPEVETIRNQLDKKVKGKKIKKIEVRLPKMIKNVSPYFFKKKIEGEKIKSVNRRAKLLIIDLSNGYSLVIHLKISGQVIFIESCPSAAGEKIENLKNFTHFIYYFSDGSCLLHNDLRQFGYVKLFKTENLENFFIQENYGPEPLDKNFTLKKFSELLNKKPNKKIKPLLMDQSFIAGIGNIYSQEACWGAKILPTRLVKTFKKDEIKKLYGYLLGILKKAIERGGTTAADDGYVDAQGNQGKYVSELKVYQRDGQNCFRCGGKIKRIALAGRGTSYCAYCQK